MANKRNMESRLSRQLRIRIRDVLLWHGPMTHVQLAEEFDHTPRSMRDYTNYMHAKGDIYVHKWDRIGERGRKVPIYAAVQGERVDAPKTWCQSLWS